MKPNLPDDSQAASCSPGSPPWFDLGNSRGPSTGAEEEVQCYTLYTRHGLNILEGERFGFRNVASSGLLMPFPFPGAKCQHRKMI